MSFRRWSLIALGMAVPLVALTPLGGPVAAPVDRTVRVEASRFAYSPAVIDVNRGDRIILELVSTDVVHGLYVDGYGVAAKADPGRPARLSFVADRPGTFRLRCNVPCGGLHPFMIGKLRVAPDMDWWRALALAIPAALLGFAGWRP